MKEKRLIEFASAWKDGNLERIMSFFSKDCIYAASVGEEPGTTYVGKTAVRKGIKEMITYDSTISSTLKNINIHGNFGFWEWKYKDSDGKITIGCDVFEFKDNLIKKKNAFRKVEDDIKGKK